MYKRPVFSVLISIMLLASLLPPKSVQAVSTPQLYAAPSQAAPGGTIVFSGTGFSPGDGITLIMVTSLDTLWLGDFWTDADGNFTGSVTMPDVPPGTYDILADPVGILTNLTVLPALTIGINPANGFSGASIHFIVENLAAGQLRLDYNGAPVFGPVNVAAGVYEGDFLVPGVPYNPPGTDIEIKAVNLLGGSLLGTAVATFVYEGSGTTTYSITNIVLPPDATVGPGFTFPITGQISPPPLGPLSNYQIKILWKSGSGQVVPITVGTPTLLANGSFSANAKVPNLLAGDPIIGETGGQVGVVLFDLGAGKGSNIQLVPWINPSDPVFKVKVVDTNDVPIEGAIVDLRAFYSDFGAVSGTTSGGEVLTNNYNNLEMHPNQVLDALGALISGESDPITCKSTNVYGRTDANGEFVVTFDPASFAMLGKKVFLGYLPKPTYMDVPWDIEFPIYVNAGYKGYSILENGKPVPFKQDLRYSGYTHLFYDVKTNTKVNTDPFVVKLPALPADTKAPLPIVPKAGYDNLYTPGMVVGGFSDYLGTGIPMTAFGNFYSFPAAQFPDSWFVTAVPGARIEFQHDVSLFGSLNEDKLTLTINGQVYKFVNAGQKYEGNSECPAIVYRAVIPNMHRWAPGNYSGMIELHDISDNVTKHYVQINVKPAPTWITQPQYKLHKISFFGNGFAIRGYQFPAGDPNSTSNLDTYVNKIGQLNNRASYSDEVSQYLYADKTSAVKYSGQPATTVMNEDAGPKDYSGTVAGGTEITIPNQTVTVLDTGKIPLYRHVIGIPPIAGATLGADMWFDATLTTGGSIKFSSSGSTTTTLLVYPDATVGVDAFLDGEVLFGLASASAHAKPDIGLGMPAYFTNGNLDDTDKCFHYKLVLTWSAKAGVCPFCVKGSGSDTVFNDRNPSSCSPPPPPSTASSAASTNSYLTADTPPPPTASPALAVDGFGHTLLVWSDESNNIQSKALSGGVEVGTYPVTANNRGIDPQVAFYAPNNAVAVWTESSLASSEASGAATIEEIFQAQYLRYALWNGTSWSAAQDLTLPADSNGEGKVVLAGCPSSQAGCPSVGAVTAVWVRDMGAAYSERNFRLYYAAFTGGNWSAVAAVDPASTGTDAEATLAYSPTGAVQVVWVRDLDRDLSTATDRWLYHRQLSSSTVTKLDSLPSAAVEPSLAVNSAGEMVLAFTVATDPTAFMGNQRQLHAAKQSCGEMGCTWSYNPLVDSNGRPVHAETPSLTLNSGGQAQITYRALGFGAAYEGGPTVMPGDPLGTVIGTGEMAQAFVTISGVSMATITPSYLTTGGNTVWQTNAVFDPLLNLTYAVASQGSGPALPQLALDTLSAQGYSVESLNASPEPLAFTVSSAERDFSIPDVSVSTVYPQISGDPLSVTVSILNNGPQFASSRESGMINLVLTWDGPDGVGVPAGLFTITTSIDAGGLVMVEFTTADGSLTLPDFPYLPHTLYVQVNPSQAIPESSFENNTYTVNLGGLPAPQGLTGASQPGDSSVFLEWTPVEHESVVGYRVYRSSDGHVFEPVGSSFGPAFVDLSGVIGKTYLYRVVSYADDGFESDFSDPIQAQIDQLFPVFLPVIVR